MCQSLAGNRSELQPLNFMLENLYMYENSCSFLIWGTPG